MTHRSPGVEGRKIPTPGSPVCVAFPERHTGVAAILRPGGCWHRHRFTRADRRSERQTRDAVIAEREILREVVRIGERELLMRRLQWCDAAPFELERAVVRRGLRGEIPLGEIEASREADIPEETCRGIAVQIEATLAPGARD